jgi:hypothetical protein
MPTLLKFKSGVTSNSIIAIRCNTQSAHYLKIAFSILATIIRLHIMNYVDLSAIIHAPKLKRKRFKKDNKPKPLPKKTTPQLYNLNLKCSNSKQYT